MSVTRTNRGGGSSGSVVNPSESENKVDVITHNGVGDSGKVQLLNDSIDTGFCIVIDRTNGTIATFELDGQNNAVTEVNDPGTAYGTTEGNDTTTNVYHDSGNSRFELNNETGGSVDYSVILLA